MICASETVNTQNADFVITWSEIESLMGKKSLFFTQFRKLLAFEELASSSLENFGDLYISMRVASLIKELKDHFRKLDLKNKAAHLLPFESCELYDRDGIYGIRWAQEKYKQDPRWRPSVFAGLLLDPYDHRLDDIYRSSPLPFILSISINMDLYPHLQKISEWKAFTERLQYVEKNNDWKFLDRSLEGSPNKWHPFILYKPLETFIDHNTPNLDLWEGIIKCLEQTLPEVKKAFQDTKIEEALTQKLKDLGKL